MTINYQTMNWPLPPGAPRWVTTELLEDTIVTWQPHYAEELTEADSLEILLSVSRLFDALEQYVLSETEL